MFPGYLLLHEKRVEPDIEIALMDFEWVLKVLSENPGAIAHRKEGEAILLTAETAALKRFVREHFAEGKLFTKYGTLVRVSADGTARPGQGGQ
ncbi:MAG: hypothetical protein NZ739_06065 [Verrucomicrobiae bacterium]|nr:hypothetical protein [Verrucomicrobiae bacterium]